MLSIHSELGDRKISQSFLFDVCFLIVAAIGVFFLQTDFSFNEEKPIRIALPAETLSHLVLGYKNLTADSLWLRLIQNIDYKEPTKISKGWVFQILDAITTLDPRYAMVYRQGVVVLSVLIRDGPGSDLLYARGVKNLPSNWEIAYKAGFNALHELRDCKLAGEYFHQAAENGAPSWLNALSGRLYAKSGQYDLARLILQEGLESAKAPEYKVEFRKRLDQLDAEYRDPNKKTLIEGLECQAPGK